jgi:hypothetical protein
MNRYQSGRAFRRALEDRLRSRNLESGVSLARLRKTVVFDRFLARLIHLQPDQWVLKGGFALELRLEDKARTTKDIDVLALIDANEILSSLRVAGALDLSDWFSFEIRQGEGRDPLPLGGARFHVRSLLDGRRFEEFHVDVGIGDPIIEPLDYLEGTSLLEFSGIDTVLIPCYPVTQQIAEKLHAYTRPYVSGESSRVKDFVDLLLLAGLEIVHADRLRQAIAATFEKRGTQPLPDDIPNPPVAWSQSYRRLAAHVEMKYNTMAEASAALREFLDPILKGDGAHEWDPEQWIWT